MADRRPIHLKRTAFAGVASALVFSDEALGVQAFQHTIAAGVVYEMGFAGMRCKPDYHYRFGSVEEAQAYRDKWLSGKRACFDVKQARKKALSNAGSRFRVGDVLEALWGYDQTNYDYYQVTRVFGTRSVEIRELAKDHSYSGQAMAGDCVPMKGKFVGEPMNKRVDQHGRVKVQNWGVWASKKDSVQVGGVEVFKPGQFTTFA